MWKKVTRTTSVRLGLLGCSVVVKLPKLDDVKLVALCLAWLPSAFISDVTASSGKPCGLFTGSEWLQMHLVL